MSQKSFPGCPVDFSLLPGSHKVLYELSRGGFGVVYLALSPESTRVAIKMSFPTGGIEEIVKEAIIMKFLNASEHFPELFSGIPSVASQSRNSNSLKICPKVLGLHPGSDRCFLLMEHYHFDPFGTMLEFATISEIKLYIRELCSKLTMLHSLGITHRDIKPSNFLYNRLSGEGRLIDFGLSSFSGVKNPPENWPDFMKKHFDKLVDACKQEQVGGTHGFMSPESIFERDKKPGPHYDMWSVGCILVSFLFRRSNFFNPMKLLTKRNTIIEDYSVSFLFELGLVYGVASVREFCSKEGLEVGFPKIYQEAKSSPFDFLKTCRHFILGEKLKSFVSGLLALDYRKRMTAKEALQHPFLAE